MKNDQDQTSWMLPTCIIYGDIRLQAQIRLVVEIIHWKTSSLLSDDSIKYRDYLSNFMPFRRRNNCSIGPYLVISNCLSKPYYGIIVE